MEQLLEKGHARKRAYWQQHIDEWQRSGLTQQAYSRTNGIPLATFGYWRRKLKKNNTAKPRFYPLIVSNETLDTSTTRHDNPGLRVTIGCHRFSIEINDHFSPAVLQKLVIALEQL